MKKRKIIELIISSFIYCVLLNILHFKMLTIVLLTFSSIKAVWKMRDEKNLKELKESINALEGCSEEVKQTFLLIAIIIAFMLTATPYGIYNIVFKKREK